MFSDDAYERSKWVSAVAACLAGDVRNVTEVVAEIEVDSLPVVHGNVFTRR